MDEQLRKELNDLVRELYTDDSTMELGRKLLAILRKYGVGD